MKVPFIARLKNTKKGSVFSSAIGVAMAVIVSDHYLLQIRDCCQKKPLQNRLSLMFSLMLGLSSEDLINSVGDAKLAQAIVDY